MKGTICVVGLGYIGFPTALVFAKAGYKVIGVDVSDRVIRALQQGELHIEENGLLENFNEVRQNHSFVAQNIPAQADAFIIAVPTPINEDYTANINYVVAATKAILPYLRQGNTVIVESTIPPGTVDNILASLVSDAGWKVGDQIYLAHCPERVLPGRIFIELVENNRIVGGVNPISSEMAAEFYRSFVKGEIILTTSAAAEMAKLMENTYRDVNIALANELAKISSQVDIDALEVIRLANKHPRVNIHNPGPGVGGHCIAVDPYFIIEKAPDLSPLMTIARKVNNSMPEFVVEQVEKLVPFGKRIAVFGITYKGNVDDIRESPALEVISLLELKGYQVAIHDPHVQEYVPYKMFNSVEAAENAYCLLILSDHREFEDISQEIIHSMANPVILDTKNCIKAIPAEAELFNYANLYKLNERETISLTA